jgi:hypothetical protein
LWMLIHVSHVLPPFLLPSGKRFFLICMLSAILEVFTGPCLAVQTKFKFRPDSNGYNETLHKTFRAFFFRREEVIPSCAHLMLEKQSGSRNISHRLNFVRYFRSCPVSEMVRGNTLQIWCPLFLCRSSNAKITSTVLDVH